MKVFVDIRRRGHFRLPFVLVCHDGGWMKLVRRTIATKRFCYVAE